MSGTATGARTGGAGFSRCPLLNLTPPPLLPAPVSPLQVRREHAVRGSRHLRLPRGLALGAAARPGARHAGEERRHHLLHHADLHLHAGAGAQAALQRRRGHPAGWELQSAQRRPGGRCLRLQQHLRRGSHLVVLNRRRRGILTPGEGGGGPICLESRYARKAYKD